MGLYAQNNQIILKRQLPTKLIKTILAVYPESALFTKSLFKSMSHSSLVLESLFDSSVPLFVFEIIGLTKQLCIIHKMAKSKPFIFLF